MNEGSPVGDWVVCPPPARRTPPQRGRAASRRARATHRSWARIGVARKSLIGTIATGRSGCTYIRSRQSTSLPMIVQANALGAHLDGQKLHRKIGTIANASARADGSGTASPAWNDPCFADPVISRRRINPSEGKTPETGRKYYPLFRNFQP
jgi:hypothetical protein